MPRHHIVPKMLLRRFARHGKKLLATPRDGGKPVVMSVGRACAEIGFYDIELEPNYQDQVPRDTVEGALANFEGRASPIFDRISQGDLRLSDWDWYNLTLFVAFQLARGWTFREEFTQIANILARLELKKNVKRDHVRRYLEERDRPSADADVEAFISSMLENDWRVVPSGSASVQAMLRYALEQLHPRLFSERLLRVYPLDSPSFLTSDQPAVLWASEDRDLEANPLGAGTADAIWLPIDRRHLLSLEPNDRPERSVPANLPAAVNELVATSAEKWVFQHPDDPPLVDMARLPERPRWEIEVEGAIQDGDKVRVRHRLVRRPPSDRDGREALS